jgi:UDP-N-acetylglucosamine 2-epimerase
MLLDDGRYFVVTASGGLQSNAGFLERRCAVSAATPDGSECLGAYVLGLNGDWEARISTKFNIASSSDCMIVEISNDRLDAIVALWRARHGAERETVSG